MPVPPGGGAPLVVLIGGTFDPPHRAHIELPLRVRDDLERRSGCVGRAWLVYIPAARSPHKGAGPVASDTDRVNMLKLALTGHERAGIWADEIDRGRGEGVPSFTVDTLARAREWLDAHGCASAKIRLLIGADQALAFHRWREPRRIIELAEPAVMLRPPVTTQQQLMEGLKSAGTWSDEELAAWMSRVVSAGVIDAAATTVRDALASRSSDSARIPAILDERVLEYINSHHLYASPVPPPGGESPGHRGPG